MKSKNTTWHLILLIVATLSLVIAQQEPVDGKVNDAENKEEDDYFYIPLDDSLDYNEECLFHIEEARKNNVVRKTTIKEGDEERTIEEARVYNLDLKLIFDEDKKDIAEYEMYPLLTCLKQDHPLLEEFIRWNELIVPPSPKEVPYSLSVSTDQYFERPVRVPNEVDFIVYNFSKSGGFFIEAGANNFETDSDSLHFEHFYDWTGLLVEPHPRLFKEGMDKKRKAHAINHCLSTTDRPMITKFNLHIKSFINSSGEESPRIMCLPLYTILKAMDKPTVDYFSLDVEGAEFPILKSLPWDKIDVKVWSIETHFAGEIFPGSRQEIIDFMEDKGYQHIPYGHQNASITVWEIWDNFEQGIINDLFVKKEMPYLSEAQMRKMIDDLREEYGEELQKDEVDQKMAENNSENPSDEEIEKKTKIFEEMLEKDQVLVDVESEKQHSHNEL